MNKLPIILSLLLIISCNKEANQMEYPDSNKNYFVENIHGYDVEDSYRWLEDFTSDESLDWVKRQNDFTNKFIENSEYKKPIAEYLSGIWDSDSQSTPFKV
ncbi:S9 family peptidase, partial [Gammaproteobacteria bacterium]|nr:S9 family peptidase [Gammaproteobacteria bacterium]